MEKVRVELSLLDAVTERPVMSGIGFFVDDKMAVAVLEAGLCLRMSQTEAGPAGSLPLEFAGREIHGWVCVPESSLDQVDLSRLVSEGVAGPELPV